MTKQATLRNKKEGCGLMSEFDGDSC